MIFIILFTLIDVTCVTAGHIGTILFHHRHGKADCWNEDDLAKLRARKIFEQLIPPPVTPDKVNSKYITHTLLYFRNAMRAVNKENDQHTAIILREALADAIGAHLRSEILPTVRYAYYAGYVPYRKVRKLHDFLEEIKTLLNTQGIGWAPPDKVPQWSNLTVVKILIGSGRLIDPCTYLVTKRDSSSCIHIPWPKLDDPKNPSAVALPFKTDGLINLASPSSENVLLKYYTTASRCILQSSPPACRHSDFVTFNNELWHWMKRDVAPHLADEKLYAAYAGVLRIAAAVQNYGKGLARRNLFATENTGIAKWTPWNALTQSYIYLNSDWSPTLYVGFICLAALGVCLSQICYDWVFGEDSGCNCKGQPKVSSEPEEVAYADVESNFPAMLPAMSHQSGKCSEKKAVKSFIAKSKASSLGSIRTQKVYDLNENTEKLMDVIISDNEESADESTSPSKHEDSDECEDNNVIDVGQAKRPRSPPKIETSIAQLRINRMPPTRLPLYSASTLTRSEGTFCKEAQASDSVWSATGSSTSDQSITSTSSKSRRSRSSRDLAWARRVISKHSMHGRKSTSGTEADNCFTTSSQQ